jgi:hypothetical protein
VVHRNPLYWAIVASVWLGLSYLGTVFVFFAVIGIGEVIGLLRG